MNINNNINALNYFDPSRGSYLEVAVDENGIEQLQVVQKNGFQVFIMWLGRIFCCCQNSSTSMKRIIELISHDIETICKNPQATREGLERFLDKIIKYDSRHPNEITESVERIAIQIFRTPKTSLRPRLSWKSPDWIDIEDADMRHGAAIADMIDTAWKVAPTDLAGVINYIEKICSGIDGMDHIKTWQDSIVIKVDCIVDLRYIQTHIKIDPAGLRSVAVNSFYEIFTAMDKDPTQLKLDFIQGIKKSNYFMEIMSVIVPRWAELGNPENIICNFVDTYIGKILNSERSIYQLADQLKKLGIPYIKKRLQNKDFLSNLQTLQRQNIIELLFYGLKECSFNMQEQNDILITVITSDKDLNNELKKCTSDRILDTSDSALQIIICGGLLDLDVDLVLKDVKEEDLSPDKRAHLVDVRARLAVIKEFQTYKQPMIRNIFETIFKDCRNPTLSFSPLSTIAITPTKKLMELFSPTDATQILPNVLILLIMEYYGRGTVDEPVTPKCFNQLYVDIAIKNRKAPNSGVHINVIESDSKEAAS